MFDLLLVCGYCAFALPLAIAALRGWAPRRVRRRTAPWVIRVRGVALLVLWASAMVVPLARQLGADSEDSTFLTFSAQFGLMMFAAGLVCGAQAGERFSRQAAPVG
ncbi:hypothetical protein P1P75_17435 [Streptomyces sp. ID05-39B]|uniref:hypothetical protein n=1 Tax=Streptomyces sp. ID05-39B TaxID=3028664 RepID=UPI0029A71613|nr:hypothetical protein [Streptomyces sp. ID05-39B]MDX3528169.1 hypothetical protein [Streptomyces sp. ID05-39B]